MKMRVRDKSGTWHPAGYVLPVRPELMPHQKHGANWLAAHPRAILASEQGLGKTAMIVETINRLQSSARVLILCPSALRANWLKELALWLTEPRRCVIAKRYIPEAPVVIIHFDALARLEVQLRQWRWDLIAIDEAHTLRVADTIKARQVIGDEWTDPLRAGCVIVATGTPIINRPAEVWPLLAILGHPITREQFEARFVDPKDHNGCRDPEELRDLLAPLMLRQTKAECLKLPPKYRRLIAFTPNGQRTASLGVPKAVGYADMAALRAVEGLAKVALPAVQDYLREAVRQEGKVVFMCHHEATIDAVAALFPGECVTFTGTTSPKARNLAVERFQADPAVKVFVGTIGSCGVGLTLTAARRMIFLEYSYSEALQEQAADRIHRIGQMQQVLIEYVVIAGSQDAHAIRLHVEKQIVVDQVINKKAA